MTLAASPLLSVNITAAYLFFQRGKAMLRYQQLDTAVPQLYVEPLQWVLKQLHFRLEDLVDYFPNLTPGECEAFCQDLLELKILVTAETRNWYE